MLEFLFNKVAGFRSVTLMKETPTQVFSCEYYNIFKNTYFEKHLPTAASVNCKIFYRATENQIERSLNKNKNLLSTLNRFYNVS